MHLLDTYEVERKPHVKTLVGFAKKAGEVIGELDPAAALARDTMLRGQLERGEQETIRQRFIPNLTTGVIDAASLDAAGTLFVQPRVQGDAQAGAQAETDDRLLDDVVAPGFLLVTATAEAQAWLTPQALDLWRRIGGERVVIGGRKRARRAAASVICAERGDLFADWMTRHGAAAVVVRPDRYVYGVARDRGGLNRMVKSAPATHFRVTRSKCTPTCLPAKSTSRCRDVMQARAKSRASRTPGGEDVL